jgi:hypothetical protein
MTLIEIADVAQAGLTSNLISAKNLSASVKLLFHIVITLQLISKNARKCSSGDHANAGSFKPNARQSGPASS